MFVEVLTQFPERITELYLTENALEKIDGELKYFADKVKQYLENIFEETVKSFDIIINNDTYHYDGTDIEALNNIRTND